MLPGTPEKSRGHTMRLERIVLWTYQEDGFVKMLELRVYGPAEVRVAGYAGGSLRAAVRPRAEFLKEVLLGLYRLRDHVKETEGVEPPYFQATNSLLMELGRETGEDLGTLVDEFAAQLDRTEEPP